MANTVVEGWYDITDHGSNFATALAAIPAAGGVLYLPPGTWTVATTQTIPSGVTILGDGPAVSILKCTSATEIILEVAPGSANVAFQNFGLTYTTSPTSASYPALFLDNCSNVSISDIAITNAYYAVQLTASSNITFTDASLTNVNIAIVMSGSGSSGCTDVFCSNVVVSDLQTSGTGGYGFLVFGGNIGVNQRLHFIDCSVYGNASTNPFMGFNLRNANNVLMQNCVAAFLTYGILLSAEASTDGIANVSVSNSQFLSCGTACLAFFTDASGGNIIRDIQFSNSQFNGSSTNGVATVGLSSSSVLSGVSFLSCTMTGNASNGLYFVGGAGWS